MGGCSACFEIIPRLEQNTELDHLLFDQAPSEFTVSYFLFKLSKILRVSFSALFHHTFQISFAFTMVQATTTYGFIGLGQMGHGMAKNIRQKIPENCNLVIYDVREETMASFINDFGNGSNVLAATSPKHVAELAVSRSFFTLVNRWLVDLTNSQGHYYDFRPESSPCQRRILEPTHRALGYAEDAR